MNDENSVETASLILTTHYNQRQNQIIGWRASGPLEATKDYESNG